MENKYAVYPNMRTHVTAQEPRGYIRYGVVADNVDTRQMEIHGFCPAGRTAVVTEEEDCLIRFYIWTQTRATMCFPGVPIWVGPFSSISEDVESKESKGDDENE